MGLFADIKIAPLLWEEDNLSNKDEHKFIAEIIEAKEKSIIVKPEADSKEIRSSDKISIGITRPTNSTNDFYVVGNKVKITYNGIIMESYPAQIIATKIELVNWSNYWIRKIIYVLGENKDEIWVR